MSFIEQHESWCRSRAALVSSEVGGPISVQMDLPEELRLWHESGIVRRVAAHVLLGVSEGEEPVACDPKYPEEDHILSNADRPSVAELPGIPVRAVPFALGTNFFYGVETMGPKRGWLYWSYGIPEVGVGPLATSISQYLYAIRGFADAGLIDLDGSAPWMPTGTSRWPPEDTPLSFFEWGFRERTTGEFRQTMQRSGKNVGDPMPGSYLDLLPDFVPVS